MDYGFVEYMRDFDTGDYEDSYHGSITADDDNLWDNHDSSSYDKDGFVEYMRDFDTGDYEDSYHGSVTSDDCDPYNYYSSSCDPVILCNRANYSSEHATCYTDFSSEPSFTYSDFTHESEDFCALPKVDMVHGKTKDQRRILRKKKMIQFVKSLDCNEFNFWEKHKKNKSMKANKKWNHCEMSQILC
jgi:hypothetical protein